MTAAAYTYVSLLASLANKEIDLDSDTLKVMLCTSGYAPARAHRYKSEVTREVTGTGYTAGGLALTGVTVATSGTVVTLDCADPVWSAATITARYAVFYDATPATDATRPLLCYWDFGADVAASGGPFTLTVGASGLLTFTAS